MSENDPNGVDATVLTADDIVEDKAAGPWMRAGPIVGEGNAIRQLFASGTLDGGTVTVEACMNGPYANPNADETIPLEEDIVSLAADVALTDFAERAQQVFATRANWLRIAVTGAGAALDVKAWLR